MSKLLLKLSNNHGTITCIEITIFVHSIKWRNDKIGCTTVLNFPLCTNELKWQMHRILKLFTFKMKVLKKWDELSHQLPPVVTIKVSVYWITFQPTRILQHKYLYDISRFHAPTGRTDAFVKCELNWLVDDDQTQLGIVRCCWASVNDIHRKI